MKILYGVPSEGMGHATRSKVIITHLLKRHEVTTGSLTLADLELDRATLASVLGPVRR